MSDIKGKIVLKTPFICECCIRSDRVYKTLNSFMMKCQRAAEYIVRILGHGKAIKQ